MFCAFDGAPNIVRFHGTGRVVTRYDDEYPALAGGFTDVLPAYDADPAVEPEPVA